MMYIIIWFYALRGEQDGSTPIFTAAYNGKVDVVRVLLDGGADPNIQDNVRMRDGGREGIGL